MKKILGKFVPSFKLIFKGLLAGVIGSVVLLNIGLAYIMFAPDNFPKPFHLSYKGSETEGTGEGTGEDSEENSLSEPSLIEPNEVQAAPGESDDPSASHEALPGHGLMMETGTKIVNLAEPNGRKYIRVNIVLEFEPDDLEYYELGSEEKELFETTFEEEIYARMPIINDSIITLMSSKTFEEVYTADGKEALREEIIEILNERLTDYHVVFVYLTEFVVQ